LRFKIPALNPAGTQSSVTHCYTKGYNVSANANFLAIIDIHIFLFAVGRQKIDLTCLLEMFDLN
jgi:hypothetical protein